MSEVDQLMCVGAAIGGGFDNSMELRPMKYHEAIKKTSSPRDESSKAVKEGHQRMESKGVFKAVPKAEVPKDTKIIASTRAMKLKVDGTKRARLITRGFEQEGRKNFDMDSSTAAPVIIDLTTKVVFVLCVMVGWSCHVLDVNGAFLLGEFEQGEKVYMEVPESFENFWTQTSSHGVLEKKFVKM